MTNEQLRNEFKSLNTHIRKEDIPHFSTIVTTADIADIVKRENELHIAIDAIVAELEGGTI